MMYIMNFHVFKGGKFKVEDNDMLCHINIIAIISFEIQIYCYYYVILLLLCKL